MAQRSASSRSGLTLVDGRPSVVADGKTYTVFYSETHPAAMHKHNRQLADAGAEVFLLIVRGDRMGDFWGSHFWRDDGVFGDEADRRDGLELNRQAAEILDVNPDARFFVRWASNVPQAWAKKNPDHLQADEHTRLEVSSYASEKAAKGKAEMTRRIVRYCEAQSWGPRVLGYIPFGQDEGTHDLSLFHSLFDQAPVMQQAFRAFLKKKYKTDATLRTAWGDAKVRLKHAVVPTESEWLADRAGWMHWPAPQALTRYNDYFFLLRDLQWMQRKAELAAVRKTAKRPVLTATDAYKEPMLGWLHNDAFHGKNYGPAYRNVLLASGCFDAGAILDKPELDALITPADYTARSNGLGWDAEGIGDSLVLRGKTILIEDDARSWATDERKTQGAWRTKDECRAGLLRNLALGASRGHLPYWMNVGGGYFDDPDVLDVVAAQVPLRQTLLTRPFVRTEHAVCMILDDTSPLDENFTSGFQNLAVLRQRNDHLCTTGLPWRTYLFSDLERDDFPVYRVYLLPNCFRLTRKKIDRIRRKLLRNGSVVILGPGTGITDGRTRGAKPLERLMAMPFDMKDVESARRVIAYGGAHPALADMRGPVTYGDSFGYGPVLAPPLSLEGTGAVELGKVSSWWYDNVAGLVLKEFGRGAANNGTKGKRGTGDGALVFSMAVPLPADLLRALALYAGCTPWSDLGDVVAACGNLLAVHSIRPGQRTATLAARCTVTDAVAGKVVAKKAKTFSFTLRAPDTRVFLLD